MPLIRAAPVKRVSATRVASMKRFWSDELQDEISRLTGLCVEQRDRIASLERAFSASRTLSGYWRDQYHSTLTMVNYLLRPEPPRDPKIAEVVDDFIQREACGMREEVAGVHISDGVNSTIVDLSSDHT